MNSLSHYNLVHKFIPVPEAMKNSRCKDSSGEGMGKLKEIPAWLPTKVRSKKIGDR